MTNLKINTIDKNSREDMLLWILIVILFIINLSLINNDSVWCDEAFTMIQCRGDFQSMMNNALVDSWPPFYSVASWIFAQIFGASVPVLKIFSIIPAILNMILGVTYIKKLFNNTYVAGLFILMNGIMPISLHMNVEIRGYSWGMFFVTFCGVLSYKYYKYGHNWKTFFGMISMGLLAAYTHYFALVSVALVFMFLFIALLIRDWKNIIVCLGITVLCFCAYLPWLTCFLKAAKSVSSGYWIPEISLSGFLQFFLYPFTYVFDNFGQVTDCHFSFLFLGLVIFLVIGLIEKIYIKGIKNSISCIFSLACLAVWGGTILIGYIVSKLINPMFVGRYMYFSVGLLWLFIALASYEYIHKKKVLLALSALIIVVGVYGYIEQRSSGFENATEITKDVVNSHFEDEMGIFSDSDYLNWTVIKYYFPESIHSESGANIDVITDQGKREKFLFMATKDFSQYEYTFMEYGYNVEYLGYYGLDKSYYFNLYKMTKIGE